VLNPLEFRNFGLLSFAR